MSSGLIEETVAEREIKRPGPEGFGAPTVVHPPEPRVCAVRGGVRRIPRACVYGPNNIHREVCRGWYASDSESFIDGRCICLRGERGREDGGRRRRRTRETSGGGNDGVRRRYGTGVWPGVMAVIELLIKPVN